jgi:lactobin A/cerein 7B family class IIb bacteriocin
MATLNTLSAIGTELTDEQLDEVDGGLVALAVAVICFGVGYAIGKNL